MRNAFMKSGIAALFFAFGFAAPLVGQEASGQGNRGVQVGVPDGRNPGDGGASNQRRRPKEPAKPAPRTADGHAALGSTPEGKGLWLPGPVIPNPLGLAP